MSFENWTKFVTETTERIKKHAPMIKPDNSEKDGKAINVPDVRRTKTKD